MRMSDDDEQADETIDATPAVQQRLAWDIVPCEQINEEMWRALGLMPPSQDVADAAHQESHDRIALCSPLVPFTEVHIALVNDIVTKLMMKYAGDKVPGHAHEIPQAFTDSLAVQNGDVIRAAIYPILAAMIEAGIITYGPAMGNVLGL